MSRERLKPIMFVGTGSDVGKSVINAAFCRIFLQDGYEPAPFKAQNMSLNSFATSDQLEIGRAQAVQAEACGIECRADMNPILLKPTDHTTAQVVLNGVAIGNKSASDYFNRTDRSYLFEQATQAFERLVALYNPIVIEGAGSISEVNLWDKDIVNMRMARYAEAATYLIADIDRGGVFGSVYGSLALLPPQERALIKGVLINKFRGDIDLFADGRRMLEELTGVPVVGVIPYFEDIEIEQEDSVVIDRYRTRDGDEPIRIAVVLLRHLSNFTDFNSLEQQEGVLLYYARNSEELERADIVIIPGSKNTIADLADLRSRGIAGTLLRHHRNGKPIYGICGGFQMMGQWIHDPNGVEGEPQSMPGLAILPVETTLELRKTTRQCSFKLANSQGEGIGYEIHVGRTPTHAPFSILENGEQEGYYSDEKTWGTYLHGVFDNPDVVDMILRTCGAKQLKRIDYKARKEENYDRLAAWIRTHTDMNYIYKTLQYD